MKKTILFALAFLSVALAFSQTARVQIIHNYPLSITRYPFLSSLRYVIASSLNL